MKPRRFRYPSATTWISILGVPMIVLIVALTVRFHLSRIQVTPETSPTATDTVLTIVAEESLPFDPVQPEPAISEPWRPTIALIIDDMGNSLHASSVKRALALPAPLTVAVIPNLRDSDATARAAFAAEKEIIVHIPMEPLSKDAATEKNMIFRNMNPFQIVQFLDDASTIPGAIGINNHMGSAATQDSALAAIVATWCWKHSWFLLDSVTHPRSVLYREAQNVGTKAARRDFFLDHTNDHAHIRKALANAVERATRLERPVYVIGHPRRRTMDVLEEEIPKLIEESVRFVTLSKAIMLQHSEEE